MNTVPAPTRLPDNPRRAILYVHRDTRGDADEYVLHALKHLRPHADLIVVMTSDPSVDAERRLRAHADTVIEYDGGDLDAYREGLRYLQKISLDPDEVLLTNDTWYGPVGDFTPVFHRMRDQAVHVWELTEYQMHVPSAFSDAVDFHRHVAPYWLAVRASVLRSDWWSHAWTSPDASIRDLGALLTALREAGAESGAAFPASDYPHADPSLYCADILISSGFPILRRLVLMEWPPFLDRNAIVGRWIIDAATAAGYPAEYLLSSLVRNVPPKVLNADANMLEVLSDVDMSYDATRPMRIAAVAHIFYEDMTGEMLERLDTLPGQYDLFVTTPSAEKAAVIEALIADRPRDGRSVEVRVLESNDGRDQSAFLIGSKDVILGGEYDLIVKIHSKKTPQDGYNIGLQFKLQQFDNLLKSPGYTANVVALFQAEPGLGLVFPPTVHLGYPTMGRGWWTNKEGFGRLARDLDIRVPLDDISPLAPYGSMFFARPEALRILAECEWSYSDFGGVEAYQDGGLAHILERAPVYVAAELGYHARTVANREYMSISHTALEYNYDHLSAPVSGRADERILFLRKAGYLGEGKLREMTRAYMRLNHPRVHEVYGRWRGRIGTIRRTASDTVKRRARKITRRG